MKEEDGLIQEIDQLLSQLVRDLSIALNDKVTGGVTMSQLMIMRKIALGVETVGEISNKLNITPAAVSKLVDQLVKMDLITRLPSAEDRRVIVLELTGQGKSILKNNTLIRHEMLKEMLNSTTAEELEAFTEILGRISLRLHENNNMS